MIDAQTRRQFTRYIIVGGVSNLSLYIAFIGLTALGWGHKTAMTLLYVVGGLLTFMANRSWSFKHEGCGRSALVRYVLSYILGYLLNLALLWFFVDIHHLPHQFVQAVAIVLVAVFLFLMNKLWVFAPGFKRESTE